MRHIAYATGTRADYGLMRNTLKAILRHPELNLSVIATGMHVMPKFGKSINEIKKDNFKIYRVRASFKDDTRRAVAEFSADFSLKLTELLSRVKPDILLLLGDRPEMLSAAITATYLGIPIAHVHGGDVSSTVDEAARHAITKLAHIHLAATEKSAGRIKKMGEKEEHIHVVGAPGLDGTKQRLYTKKYLEERFGLNLRRQLLLVLQHPAAESQEAGTQMQQTMHAVSALRKQTVVIYPNADPGSNRMIEVIEEYRETPFVSIYDNLDRKAFLSLMKSCSVLIGNSSAGIIEATSFRVPVVNIGTRQDGRERGANVIDVDPDCAKIVRTIKKAVSSGFRNKVRRCRILYGDGKAAERISGILAAVEIDENLMQKKITY